MTRFDPEIIAALAEGTLDPQEAEALEREIAAVPAAAAALQAQRMALGALRSAPAPTLTAAERTELHRRLSTDLGLEREVSEATSPRRVPWGSIAVAGAALVGIVALVPVAGLLSTSGESETAGTIGAEASLTTEPASLQGDGGDTADAPDATDATDSRAAGDGAEEADATSGTEESVSATTIDTETATTTTDTTITDDTATGSGQDATTTTGQPPEAEAQSAERSAWLEQWRDEEADPATAGTADTSSPCWAEAEETLERDTGVYTENAEYSEEEVVAYYVLDEDGAIRSIAAFMPEDCELLSAISD